MTVSTNEKMQH